MNAPNRSGASTSSVVTSSSGGQLELGNDFPFVCETCLGPNPYLRMVKLKFGERACAVTQLPFQAFRWKPGNKGRYKETVICREVAMERNICQACLMDMTFGVPVGVRDAILSSSSAHESQMPMSHANVRFYYEQKLRDAQVGSGPGSHQDPSIPLAIGDGNASQDLVQLARRVNARNHNPSQMAFRNLPKLCSFWVAGTCSRVVRGTCPFRPCCGTFLFPELASSQPELNQDLIDRLNRDGVVEVMKSLSTEEREILVASTAGNKQEAIKRRVMGNDDLAKKYLGKIKRQNEREREQLDEEDQRAVYGGNNNYNNTNKKAMVTVKLSPIAPSVTEQDLKEALRSRGLTATHFKSISIIRALQTAFVEFFHVRHASQLVDSTTFSPLSIQKQTVSVSLANEGQRQNQPRRNRHPSSAPAPFTPSTGMQPPPQSSVPPLPVPPSSFLPPPPSSSSTEEGEKPKKRQRV